MTVERHTRADVPEPPTPPFRKGDTVSFNSTCSFVRQLPVKVVRLVRDDTRGSGWSATVRCGPPLFGYYWRNVDAAWFTVDDCYAQNTWQRDVRAWREAKTATPQGPLPGDMAASNA